MNRGEFRDLLERMAAGWNSGDAEAVADCFAEDVSYADPTRYSFSSREELLPFFEPPEGGSQRVVWHRILSDEAEQAGAAEYTYEGHHGYHGAVIATVRDGRVLHWREWQHTSDLDWEEFVGDG